MSETNDNLRIYNEGRTVPAEAKKTIPAGRLKGMTDINPMWRIKKLTELFGVCGIGWYPQIVRSWVEVLPQQNGEVVANVEILLYVKDGTEWSKGIPGLGGSKIVTSEKNGLYMDDEAYKKAYTDALSVACKALGIGADVYFERDRSKYDIPTDNNLQSCPPPQISRCEEINALAKKAGKTQEDIRLWITKATGEDIPLVSLSPVYYNKLKQALDRAAANKEA